ncbi:MAG: DUF1257 domain-containing protein [Anaerolineae bacterium]|nr:DUF1257 domain-containing protein [Anaerolineae bacterium]
MSHLSRIRTQFASKDLLVKALQDLGYQTEEGNFTIKSISGAKEQVQIRIPLRLSGDIGFHKSNEVYEVIADWAAVRGVRQKEFVNQVAQRYAYHAAREKLEAQGFTLVEEQVNETGQIRLLLRRIN